MSDVPTRPTRPKLTLSLKPPAQQPDRPVAKPPAPPAKAKLPPEQQAARLVEEQRAARLARAKAVRELREHLTEAYPAAFPSPPAPSVPLAIGIHRAILLAVKGTHSTKTVDVFLNSWTDAVPYLMALARGDVRRNLDGTVSGEPSAAERALAATALDRKAKRTADE